MFYETWPWSVLSGRHKSYYYSHYKENAKCLMAFKKVNTNFTNEKGENIEKLQKDNECYKTTE